MDSKTVRIMKIVLERGFQIEPGALEWLKRVEEAVLDRVLEDVLNEVRRRGGFIIKLSDVKRVKADKPVEAQVSVTVKLVDARDVESKIEVLFDPTGKISGGETIEGFFRYFRSRFRKLERILRRRLDVRGSIPIAEVLKAKLRSRVKFIGMVTEKVRRRGFRFQLEDLESSITVIVREKADRKLIDKACMVLKDQVLCVSGVKISDDAVLANDLIFPDIPNLKVQTSSEEVYAVLTSDMHVGSRLFMEKVFERFLRWLNLQEGSEPFRRLAAKVKYILICGDVVDGVGVYPGQEGELAVKDIMQQYRWAAERLAKIPDHIEVVVTPGNHDASRQALPQPAFFRKYAEPLYELGNVRVLGNPSLISIHGVKTLMYHGRSLDDVLSHISGLTFYKADKAMEILLKARHLAPIYGSKVAIAPEEEDYLVIEEPPGIFHSGHVHVVRSRPYRGILIVNSGAWQMQTDYQRRNGLAPIPGVVPLVNLKTLQVVYIDFRKPTLEAMVEAPRL